MNDFSKSRFGVAASLLLLAVSIAFGLFVFNRARNEARHSNQDEANGCAVSDALGFDYTGLYDQIGDKVVDKGTKILRVQPGAPFDQAGLKRDDRILLNLKSVKTLFIQRRGKMVDLPVQRGGRRPFTVTVRVPRFAVPYPERVLSVPVSPKP